ncbi:MAG: hypothetical protein BJ554DRAFT_2067, partial [Olpidium bornovanus]
RPDNRPKRESRDITWFFPVLPSQRKTEARENHAALPAPPPRGSREKTVDAALRLGAATFSGGKEEKGRWLSLYTPLSERAGSQMSGAPVPSAANAAAAAKVQELINTVTSLGRTALQYEPEMAETALHDPRLLRRVQELRGTRPLTPGVASRFWASWIDEGKNYETFTRELVQRTASENQFMCGKVWALEVRLARGALIVLETELQNTFPDEFAAGRHGNAVVTATWRPLQRLRDGTGHGTWVPLMLILKK